MADADQTLAERLLSGDKRALARGDLAGRERRARGLGAGPRGLPEHRQCDRDRIHRRARGRQVDAARRADQARARARQDGRGAVDRPVVAVHPGRAARRPDPARRSTSSTRACSSARWRTGARSAGLSEATLQAALLMDASGRDVVLLETVGVGQAEVDIIDHADTVVLVLMPGLGRLDSGAQGRDHGDSRRDRRQQGRPPVDRHDGQGDQGRARARAPGWMEGADRADRGAARRRDRGTGARSSTSTAPTSTPRER